MAPAIKPQAALPHPEPRMMAADADPGGAEAAAIDRGISAAPPTSDENRATIADFEFWADGIYWGADVRSERID